MPRFYFDVRNGSGFHHDHVGDEFASFEEARCQVQGILPDMLRDESPDSDLHTVTCDVRDETGRVVYRGKITYEGKRDPV